MLCMRPQFAVAAKRLYKKKRASGKSWNLECYGACGGAAKFHQSTQTVHDLRISPRLR